MAINAEKIESIFTKYTNFHTSLNETEIRFEDPDLYKSWTEAYQYHKNYATDEYILSDDEYITNECIKDIRRDTIRVNGERVTIENIAILAPKFMEPPYKAVFLSILQQFFTGFGLALLIPLLITSGFIVTTNPSKKKVITLNFINDRELLLQSEIIAEIKTTANPYENLITLSTVSEVRLKLLDGGTFLGSLTGRVDLKQLCLEILSGLHIIKRYKTFGTPSANKNVNSRTIDSNMGTMVNSRNGTRQIVSDIASLPVTILKGADQSSIAPLRLAEKLDLLRSLVKPVSNHSAGAAGGRRKTRRRKVRRTKKRRHQ